MKNKKWLTSLFLSLLVLLISILPNTYQAEAGVIEWIFCNFGGEEILKIKDTDYLQFKVRSKSAYGAQESVTENPFNQMLSFAGYNIGGMKGNEDIQTPFEKFGVSGLRFTSYGGEWKYYNIDPCKTNGVTETPADDYGRFYAGRIEPQSPYHQTSDSTDPRVAQFNKGAGSHVATVFKSIIANGIFIISKAVVTLFLVFLGLSFENIPEKIGFTLEIQKGIVSNLYSNFFLPMFVLISVITGVVIFYRGIVKREFRRSISAALLTVGMFFLGIAIGTNPKIVGIPNLIATTGQSLILGAFGQSDGKDELCTTAAGVSEGVDFTDIEKGLSQLSSNMRSSVGCRVWNNFLFKPWIQGQFGADAKYEDLSEDSIKAPEWIGKPEVKIGSNKTINNWALFNLSVNTDNHETIKGVQSPLINGVHKDYYRVIDALSGIDYSDKIDTSGELTRFLPNENGGPAAGGIPIGAGDSQDAGGFDKNIFERGAEYVPIVEQMLTKYGLDLKYVPVLLGIAEQESNFGRDSECGRLDPFQAAESLGMGPCELKDPAISVEAGAKHFNRVIRKAEKLNLSLWAAVQSYNFGDGYMDWLAGKGIDHSLENALEFSDMMAKRLKWGTTKVDYSNYVSKNIVKTPYRYKYGVAHYAHEVGYKMGLSEEEVLAIAQGEGGTLPGYSSGGIVNITPGGLVQRNDDGQIVLKVEKPAKTTKYWGTFIGNNSDRIGPSLLSLLFTLLAISAPMLLSITSVVYSMGLAILSAVAPIFLLLGAWPGKGQIVALQWLNTLLSTILKKIILGVLLVISIEIVGTAFDMIATNGFIVTTIVLGLISMMIIKNKNKILNSLAQINLGGVTGGGFERAATQSVSSVRTATKTGADLVTVGAVGAITAKKMGVSAVEGAKRATEKYIDNKLYSSGNFGSKVMIAKRMQTKDRQDSLVSGKDGTGGVMCTSCGDLIMPGDVMYLTENQDPICRVCGDERAEHLTEVMVPYPEEDVDFGSLKRKPKSKTVESKPIHQNYYEFYIEMNSAADKKKFVDDFIEEESLRIKKAVEEAVKKSKNSEGRNYKVNFRLHPLAESFGIDEKELNKKIDKMKDSPEAIQAYYKKQLQKMSLRKLKPNWDNEFTVNIKMEEKNLLRDDSKKTKILIESVKEAISEGRVEQAVNFQNELDDENKEIVKDRISKIYTTALKENTTDKINFHIEKGFHKYINFKQLDRMRAEGANQKDYENFVDDLFEAKKEDNKRRIQEIIEESKERSSKKSTEEPSKTTTEGAEEK